MILHDDLGLSPEFLADEDIARDVDEYDSWHGEPKCGGPAWEAGEQVGCPGCRRCSPPDREAKPYGWGIERFEDPALARASAEAAAERDRIAPKYTSAVRVRWGMSYLSWAHEHDNAYRDFLWRSYSRQSRRRLRHSDIVWERICDEAETHRKAVERYARWAARAVTIRYRDEDRACSESPPTLRPASPTGSTPSRSRRGERSPTAS